MKRPYETDGRALQDLRERLGFSRQAWAELLAVGTAYIGLLERGERTPSAALLARIKDVATERLPSGEVFQFPGGQRLRDAARVPPGTVLTGPLIRQLRRQARITPSSLAETLGVSPVYLRSIEAGTRPIPVNWTAQINAALGVDLADATYATSQRSNAGGPTLRRRLLAEVGHCEACGLDPAAQYGPEALPVLEVHLFTPLTSGGTQTVGNAALLCPSCHRLMHLLKDPVERLLRHSPHRAERHRGADGARHARDLLDDIDDLCLI